MINMFIKASSLEFSRSKLCHDLSDFVTVSMYIV